MLILSLTDYLNFLLQNIQSPTFSQKGSIFSLKCLRFSTQKKAGFVSSILIQHLSQKSHLCSLSTFAFPSKMFILSLRKLPQILAPKHPLIISGFPPNILPTDYPNFTSVP